MKKINNKLLFLLTGLVLVSFSCKKFLEVGPPKDKITPEQAFENNEIATSAMTGIYSKMISAGFGSGDRASVSVVAGLSSDELKSYNAQLNGFYTADIPTGLTQLGTLWADAYASIYSANAILEGLQSSVGVTENVKKQLTGEAKFIRAFCYFYLVNLFGEVPLNLSTDYRINEIAKKSPQVAIYNQIISDLNDAENLLSPTYISTERVRPNKWAAKAMLARVFLYQRQWDLAAQKATEVIDQKNLYSLPADLDQVFLKNSTETIWQLMPNTGNNTKEGNLFILNATPLFVSMVPEFLDAFETGDNRKTKWLKEYSNATGKYIYPFKYKVKSSTSVSEYSMIIRLAEMHLIRAETAARKENAQSSLEDINLIRKRAGLSTPLQGLNSQQCLLEIEKQRKLELFTEWGHRWLDLKRADRAESVLAPLKGATWTPTDALYPIPDNEINRNPNIEQNLGYK